MRSMRKIITAILPALVLSTLFTAVPAKAQPTWHASRPYIMSEELIAFDSSGVLWNYGRVYSGRNRIGSGWSGMAEIHVTDWNADGIKDLLAKGKDGRLHIYWGKVDGGFRASTIGHGWQNYDISVGYWKQADNYPSIIAKSTVDGRLYNYTNPSGTAIIGERILEGSGWGSLNVNLLDWDGDGGKDIAATTTSGDMLLYRTDGNGNFHGETRRKIGTGWDSMNYVGSFGRYREASEPGLLARSEDGVLHFYGFGDGSWNSRQRIGTGWNSYTIAEAEG